VFHRDLLAQLSPPLRRELPLSQLLQQALVRVDANSAPVVQRSRNEQAAHVAAGKWTIPPSSNGIITALGQQMVCASQSS
jgi:hypothetical protein